MDRALTRGDGSAQQDTDLPRSLISWLGVGTFGLAAVLDPSGVWWEWCSLVLAVAALAAWARWGVPAPVLTLVVILAVGASQVSGQLEPGMFLLSLLGITLTGWQDLTARVVALLLVTAASPLVIMALQQESPMAGAIWVLGVLFPALFGATVHRQEVLTSEREATRRALTEQAVLEERRQLAREVHDLVGHGLAAMMIQITSARHVLTRDPDAAAEALDSATGIGRQSMQDLRRAVASLRDGEDGSGIEPLPGLADVAALVEQFRAGGMSVEHRAIGDHEAADPVVGLSVHRIAQEALTNARHHAPHARTVVSTTAGEHDVLLEVETRGPVRRQTADDADRPHYGLVGMTERAEVLGADFSAGPTESGWLVRCWVPASRPRHRVPGSASPEEATSP